MTVMPAPVVAHPSAALRRQPRDHVAVALSRAAHRTEPVSDNPVEPDHPSALVVDLGSTDPRKSVLAAAANASSEIVTLIIGAANDACVRHLKEPRARRWPSAAFRR